MFKKMSVMSKQQNTRIHFLKLYSRQEINIYSSMNFSFVQISCSELSISFALSTGMPPAHLNLCFHVKRVSLLHDVHFT